MTLSLTARCDRTGALGVVIASSSPSVAARCAHVRAGAGAVATQNVTDPRIGPRGLDRMQAGLSAEAALHAVLADAPGATFRQVAMVDARGGSAAHTGSDALGLHGTVSGPSCIAAGNLLANLAVLDAMVAAFAATPEAAFGARLLAALHAGVNAGGEAGPLHSAGLLIAEDVSWPVTDLRVDWDEDAPHPVLASLWERWQPLAREYVIRALEPAASPAFGVAGEERR